MLGRSDDPRDGALALTLTAVTGFALGFVAGAVLGGSVGEVHPDRVKRALGRLSGSARQPGPAELERDVRNALRADEATRDLDLEVGSPGEGLIELNGVVSDALSRRAAGDVARAVLGVDVVVNRIVLQGSDLPPAGPPSSEKRRG
ncbi:MAG TPA: BON domain-containing protein [Gemmatimonadales bacterium]|nr:BON domain-containing protein [Gemmatimonadales bacterium]